MTSVEPSRPSLSITALLSLIGGAVLLALHTTVRLFGGLGWELESSFDPAIIFGILGLLSAVPILVEIVLGHFGFVATRPGAKRGRTAAVAGIALGYALLVLYLNRLVVVVIVSAKQDVWGDFVSNFFWWA